MLTLTADWLQLAWSVLLIWLNSPRNIATISVQFCITESCHSSFDICDENALPHKGSSGSFYRQDKLIPITMYDLYIVPTCINVCKSTRFKNVQLNTNSKMQTATL